MFKKIFILVFVSVFFFMSVFYVKPSHSEDVVAKTDESTGKESTVHVKFSTTRVAKGFLPTAPSPIKIQNGNSVTANFKSSDFLKEMDTIKKAIDEATSSYTALMPTPVSDDDGYIVGFYVPNDDKTPHLSVEVAREKNIAFADVIVSNGIDISGLKESIIGNCKVFFRYSPSIVRTGESGKIVNVDLIFKLVVPEGSNCTVDVFGTESKRILTFFKDSLLKPLIAAKKPSEDVGESTGSTTPGLLKDVDNGLRISCMTFNPIGCILSIPFRVKDAIDIVSDAAGLKGNTEREDTEKEDKNADLRDKEERNVRDKCIDSMKDKNSAVVSLEDNIRLECIRENRLIKAKFFKDNVIVRQIIRMEHNVKASQIQ